MKQIIKKKIKEFICSKKPNFSCPQDKEISVSIPEITPLNPDICSDQYRRLNLLVPSINKEDVFGGISTAITLFKRLLKSLPDDFHARVIVTDKEIGSMIDDFGDYAVSSLGQKNSSKFQIVSCSDRFGKNLPVVQNDIFLTTAWWTTYIVQEILSAQAKRFANTHPLIYLIQDFEPCFYNWSARYALAEATYRSDKKTIAIINSQELSDFMDQNGYEFYKKFYFLPKMNVKLREFWDKMENTNKKKQLIVYGRPSVDRNLFPILVESLKIWAQTQADIKEWTLLSLGEKHEDIDLGNGVKLLSKGKLTLQDYAQTLLESPLGVSLMLSPHPSYPPLEMAYFGAFTVTNRYANKDLSTKHENLINVNECIPSKIAEKLSQTALKISENINISKSSKIKDKSYIDISEQFPFIDLIVEEFKDI